MTHHSPPLARPLIEAELRPLAGQSVAVALSCGIDSTSVLLTLLDLGCHVRTYSFCMEGRRSKDVRLAAENATTLGVVWRLVELPREVDAILVGLRLVIRTLNAERKTTIETSWPFQYVFPRIALDGLTTLVTGHCSDGHFGSSRLAAIHHREADKLDLLRQHQFSDPDFCGVQTVRTLGKASGVDLVTPYRTQAVIDAYMGYSWKECNKPRPKEPVWKGYDLLTERLRLSRQPINLQLGDSGITERFNEIAEELGYDSSRAMYRAISKGEL